MWMDYPGGKWRKNEENKENNMSFGYDEVSQLKTRIAILESQVKAHMDTNTTKSVNIEQLKSENEQLTHLVDALLKKDIYQQWDGSAIEPTYLKRTQPKK